MVDFLRRLYWGATDFDFVGRMRIWLTISGILVVGSILALAIRGLNLSIEFEGGTAWTVAAEGFTTDDAQEVVDDLDATSVTVQEVGDAVRIETKEVTPTEAAEVTAALAAAADVDADVVSVQSVGPSWGDQVTTKAIQGLVVFLILVVIYITFRFEIAMAVTAIIALFHDLLLIIGVYAVFGFQVSPATVIGVLTMLGYSLYDSVVVFDKVRENSGMLATGRVNYPQLVNLSMNQTLARSLATSVTSVLPAASLLFVGSFILGAETLRDLALALFVGILAGTYSSIFVAAPLLARFKSGAVPTRRGGRKKSTKSTATTASTGTGDAGATTGGGEGKAEPAKKKGRGSGRPHGRATSVSKKRR